MNVDNPTTVRWFGETWEAPICRPEFHLPTPVGQRCYGGCNEDIKDGDRGVSTPLVANYQDAPPRAAFHLQCFLEMTGAAQHDNYRRGIEP